MLPYCPGYQNFFARLLYSFFIQLPEQLWMRWICLIIPSNKGIINKTNVSDSVLATEWQLAQQGLATAPFPLTYSGGSVHPADPRALTVQPKNVTVVSVPDVPIATLAKYIDPAWVKDSDPSGTFLMESSLAYTTVAGMTCPWTRPRVYGATSKIPTVCVYEFQNVILKKLGYDISGR